VDSADLRCIRGDASRRSGLPEMPGVPPVYNLHHWPEAGKKQPPAEGIPVNLRRRAGTDPLREIILKGRGT
jgi:hypothetical protein